MWRFFFGRESFLQGEFQASANAHYSASLRFAPQLAFQARPSIPPRSLLAEPLQNRHPHRKNQPQMNADKKSTEDTEEHREKFDADARRYPQIKKIWWLRCFDIYIRNDVLWFYGIRESAEGRDKQWRMHFFEFYCFEVLSQ